jgi:cell wall-associated NlpC family hydrolase
VNRAAAALLAACLAAPLAAAPARAGETPGWARPAVEALEQRGLLEKGSFRPNRALGRTRFAELIEAAFGGGHAAPGEGKVTAGEVHSALVSALGYAELADRLNGLASPDGWAPELPAHFGTEVVARALGLRFNRPASDDRREATAGEPLLQADIAYAVWRALEGPNGYAAQRLAELALPDYDEARRHIIAFALQQAGQPYVWAGEWAAPTPEGYPYGAQAQGGFDCSGFIWYVLKERSEAYDPPGRPYDGYELDERSARDMAAATPRRIRFGRLRPADLVFFAPDGRDSDPGTVYHAGLYLGNGWMVHSSDGGAGVNLSYIGDGFWRGQFAWGRRVVPAA